MGNSVAIPNEAVNPSKMTRKERRAFYANRENRKDYVRVRKNPRIVGLPISMLQGSMGPDYVAHAKAGAVSVIVFRNDDNIFSYAHRHRTRKVIGRPAVNTTFIVGEVPVGGRAGVVKFLVNYCEENDIPYNKIVYGLVG